MSASSPVPGTPSPACRLLSNGRYTVMLTQAGSGFSRWRDLAVTRWREDPTCDAWGSYTLLRDVASGAIWSAGQQPCGNDDDDYVVTLSDARADFARRHDTLTSTLSVTVSGDCDAELRSVTLANHGDLTREIDVTSYAELILGSAAGDAAHPAFSKMFVQTEWTEQGGGMLLATRRRRASDDAMVWAAHFAVADGADSGAQSHETDRARFLGRGRTLRHAQAMQPGADLSNTTGCVLDPIFSVRQRVRVAPGAEVRVSFWTVLADSREAVIAQGTALRSAGACERAFASAAAHVVAERARFGIVDAQDEFNARLVAPLLISDATWRAPRNVLARGKGGAPVLWAKGISGDRPIVLLRIAAIGMLDGVRDLLRAQAIWQSKRFGVDVVLLNTASTATDDLQAKIAALVDAQQTALKSPAEATPASVFALRDDAISADLRDGLATVARVVLDATATGWKQTAEDGAAVASSQRCDPPPALRTAIRNPMTRAESGTLDASLEFDNGRGGFAQEGREYVIDLSDGACTPMPWVNIIANPSFGFMVSAEGGGYAWSVNSQQNAITPWPNDPVSDTPHDVLYLRDCDSGDLWSATASPIRVPSARCTARHGKGWSQFTNTAHGIDLDLLQFVPVADSIKLSRLRLHNVSGRARRLSIAAYVEWGLGANGVCSAPFVVTSIDEATGALFARNAWRAEFGERIAFIDLDGRQTSWSGDRREFLGHYGEPGEPAALRDDTPLSGQVGAGLDPCGALQTGIELAVDEQIEIVFMLGEAASTVDAQNLVKKYRTADLGAALAQARALWDDMLDTVQVRTPDRAMDIVLNDWLPYQTLGCRVWARTAYYQASGAYGFRDQLQDVMAMCVSRPDVAREQILRAASRQFVEGDVQHWWLPPSGQGIRTRMTDDRIWLAYVVAHYVAVTGDDAVYAESVPFLQGDALKEGQDESFFLPTVAPDPASLYEHCARALDVSLALGAHGLPLMGTGDWNDGMNRVGEKGHGESVWLAWFLIATIDASASAAQAHGDNDRLARWQQCAASVRVALEGAGWDGKWYRRGYYDDGTPLGSDSSLECKIDAIAQSWSVMSGVADPTHAAQAMRAVDERLIRHDDKIALLFTPPFDRTPLDPGYIKGYPPGIRENGGQYTHGTIWSIFAFAALGQGDKAGELFSILNPILHGDSPEALARYKVEPYVSCADVYSVDPLVGRGGWTWYSGSAGWLYRAGIEAVLGFHKCGDSLQLEPCIPDTWPGYEIKFRHRGKHGKVTRYDITVENPQGVCRGVVLTELDGVKLADDPAGRVPLVDDGAVHRVRVVLG
ncbi:MAG: glycosyl transferase family 36 [Dokdonella sp.]